MIKVVKLIQANKELQINLICRYIDLENLTIYSLMDIHKFPLELPTF